MVSDEVCGVAQGRIEFCGGIKSGEGMGGYVWKLIVCTPVVPTKVLVTCLWELVSFLLHFYHFTDFSRFDDVSKNWIGSISLFINPLLKKLLMTNLRTS